MVRIEKGAKRFAETILWISAIPAPMRDSTARNFVKDMLPDIKRDMLASLFSLAKLSLCRLCFVEGEIQVDDRYSTIRDVFLLKCRKQVDLFNLARVRVIS